MRFTKGVTVRILPCVLLVLVVGSCKKKLPSVTVTPDETRPDVVRSTLGATMPTIEVMVAPDTIERGAQTTLSWKSTNATSVLIDGGVGNVAESGSLVLSPSASITYTAIAHGSGAIARDSARVTVVPRNTERKSVTDIEGLQQAIEEGRVRPIFFDYGKVTLSAESKRILEENARWIKRFPAARVIVDGCFNDRGSEEYNLAVGDRRAQATRDHLLDLGVSATQLQSLSCGGDHSFERCHDEACWRKNRRVRFVVKR